MKAYFLILLKLRRIYYEGGITQEVIDFFIPFAPTIQMSSNHFVKLLEQNLCNVLCSVYLAVGV